MVEVAKGDEVDESRSEACEAEVALARMRELETRGSAESSRLSGL